MSRKPESGFTLLEIMVVVVVIGVLAGLVGPMVFRNVGDAKTSAAKAQIELFALALDQYRLDNGYYPTTEQGLASLREAPGGDLRAGAWRAPYLRKDVPLDPWNRPYVYSCSSNDNPDEYDLLTYGRDGEAGGEGEDADIL